MPEPNLQAVRPATKLVPVSVTTVLPTTEPDNGDTDVTVPAATYSTWIPLWLISPPLLIAISTTRMPDPRAGITQLAAEDDVTLPATYAQEVESTDDPPTAQCTPRAVENPAPTNAKGLPGTTVTGDSEVTFIVFNNSKVIPLAAVKSWPFADTSTVMLPATPATVVH
jgi:hypothetical protein